MKWNRGENWTELKGRAKRQLDEMHDNGFDITSNYANQHANNEEASHKPNQDATDIHMAHLHSQLNSMQSSNNGNEDNSYNSTYKGMNGFEN